ncbi:tetraspanin-19-like [Arachis stenosperma]|uniref:tetraspanin-19-like n=1 Tax=Arachis stenosperma TaxID=217475 RepID=UPI0025AB6915|nr:tetraspanin-19-like [Arachis stenosperma]
MISIARTLRSFFKFFNSIMGMVGMSMIIYGLWIIKIWLEEREDVPPTFEFVSETWFAYTLICSGVFMCVVTCLGHMAADSMNGYCLSCYMVSMIIILLLEGAVTADILLNSDWEKDLPEDPTGKFSDFMDFVESNFDVCKWIMLVIISAQGLSTIIALVLKAHGPDSNYDSDYDYYTRSRLSLLYHNAQPPPFVPDYSLNNNTCWDEGKYIKNTVATFPRV